MDANKSYVVAVSGPVGGGKTTLVKGLAAALGDAVTIFFDHYEQITAESMQSIRQWMEAGTDVDQFTVPQLTSDLQLLKRGQPVRHPSTRLVTAPRKYIIFETPFGRLHKATAAYTDFVVWIDTPLDIALARKARELTGLFLDEQPLDSHRDCLAWLHGYFDNYVNTVGILLKLQQERVGSQADLVLDGRADTELMIREAARQITERLP